MPVECNRSAYPHLADDAAPGAVAAVLLDWYDRNARSLPWRAPPGAPPPDPYRVWLSEIMLQQTTVVAAAPYFRRFTARWPTVAALAAADDAEIMAAWAGLGYYARARNMAATARRIAGAGGRFPDSETGLRSLPGVGAYTAAAIAAIAFGERAVVVDANVERVVARLAAIDLPLPAAKPALRAVADRLTPAVRSGDFAQAMMDLGATICVPRTPRCPDCPLARFCRARDGGNAGRYPVKPARAAKPERTGTAYWIEQDGQVWIVTRPPAGLLGGLAALPDDGWTARIDGDSIPPIAADWQDGGRVTHVFTHFRLTLALRVARAGRFDMNGGTGRWVDVGALGDAGLPTLFAKAARKIVEERE